MARHSLAAREERPVQDLAVVLAPLVEVDPRKLVLQFKRVLIGRAPLLDAILAGNLRIGNRSHSRPQQGEKAMRMAHLDKTLIERPTGLGIVLETLFVAVQEIEFTVAVAMRLVRERKVVHLQGYGNLPLDPPGLDGDGRLVGSGREALGNADVRPRRPD